MVRAKFTVTEITQLQWGGPRIVLSAMYDQAIPEDQSYAKATPQGRVEMVVDNPSAALQFTLGQAFYLDFTPVPAPEPVPA